MLRQRLFNTDEDPKNRPFINTGASIPISTCKLRKRTAHTSIAVYLFQLAPINPQCLITLRM